MGTSRASALATYARYILLSPIRPPRPAHYFPGPGPACPALLLLASSCPRTLSGISSPLAQRKNAKKLTSIQLKPYAPTPAAVAMPSSTHDCGLANDFVRFVRRRGILFFSFSLCLRAWLCCVVRCVDCEEGWTGSGEGAAGFKYAFTGGGGWRGGGWAHYRRTDRHGGDMHTVTGHWYF